MCAGTTTRVQKLLGVRDEIADAISSIEGGGYSECTTAVIVNALHEALDHTERVLDLLALIKYTTAQEYLGWSYRN